MQTNRNVYLWDGTQFAFDYPVNGSGNIQTVNTGLKPDYTDEFNIGLQRQMGSTMAVGIRGIYRKWYNLIDDIRTRDADGNVLKHPTTSTTRLEALL